MNNQDSHYQRGTTGEQVKSGAAAEAMIAAMIVARKGESDFDCRGASIRGDIGGCGVGCGSSGPSLFFDGLAAPVAVDVHLEDGGVMDEAVDGGQRHGGIWKDLSPFAERLVGGDQHGSPFITSADEFEQHAGLGLVLGDIGEVVEDQEVEAVEAVDRVFGYRDRWEVYDDWNPTREAAGLPEWFTPHVCCHTWATWMRQHSKSDLRGLVGTGRWKDIKSVMRYQHVVATEESKKADLLPLTLRSAKGKDAP